MIEPLEIVVARSAKSDRPTCDYLAAQMVQDLSLRPQGRAGTPASASSAALSAQLRDCRPSEILAYAQKAGDAS